MWQGQTLRERKKFKSQTQKKSWEIFLIKTDGTQGTTHKTILRVLPPVEGSDCGRKLDSERNNHGENETIVF